MSIRAKLWGISKMHKLKGARTHLGLAICAVAMGILLAGCGKKQTTQEVRYDEAGNRLVSLYCFTDFDADRLDIIVKQFNKNASGCRIVMIKPVGNDAYGGELTKMIAEGEAPDLIYSTYSTRLFKLVEDELIEDLIPYIEASDALSTSDLDDNVVKAYTVGGKLIGLPSTIMFDALWTIDNFEDKYEAGWTYDDFFDWMRRADTPGGPLTSKEYVLNHLFPPMFSKCVSEDGKADFINDTFKNLLSEIAKLNMSTKPLDKKESWQFLTEHENAECWLGTSVISYDNLYQISAGRGRELNFVGYPSFDKKLVAYYDDMTSLSIVSASGVKDDAYAFVQYYITYMEGVRDQNLLPQSYIFTYLKNREASIQAAFESVKDDPVATKIMKYSVETADNLIKNAVCKDYKTDEVLEIVREEAMAYLNGEKRLDDVCNVIERRVQLHLDEGK